MSIMSIMGQNLICLKYINEMKKSSYRIDFNQFSDNKIKSRIIWKINCKLQLY